MSDDLLAKIDHIAFKQLEYSEKAGEIYYHQADRVIANAAALVAISGTNSLVKNYLPQTLLREQQSEPDTQSPPSAIL